MKATIWHNARCSKSRAVLAILNDTPDIEVEVIGYVKHPPTRATLAALLERAGLTPHGGLRSGETLAIDLDLAQVSGAAVLDAMVADPILIERPLVETERGAVLARPPERVRDIL